MPTFPPLVVAVLGAPGTGAQAVAAALQSRIAVEALQVLHLRRPPADHTPDLTLLMGLDLPCPAPRRLVQEAADARLRAALARANLGYRVVYGWGEQRVAHAMKAIKSIAIGQDISKTSGTFDLEVPPKASEVARLRAWNCEKCSDPQCEHRLFTTLVGLRAASPGG